MKTKKEKWFNQAVKDEWEKFDKDEIRKIEFNTSFHFFKKYLPKKGLILDAGGGPGRYTIELAKKGYDVILVDLDPSNLEFAMQQVKAHKVEDRIKGVIEGDITNLSEFGNNSFDAIIALGNPIGHLTKEKDRKQGIKELTRVAKKGAPIFISAESRFAIIRDSPGMFPREIRKTKYFFEYAIKGEDKLWYQGYNYAHYFTLEEFRKLVDKDDVRIVEQVGLEGLATMDLIDKVFKNKASKGNWMDMHYKLCTHPSVVDTSLHMMLILKKK